MAAASAAIPVGLIGAGVGAGIGLIGAAGYFGYKWWKKRKPTRDGYERLTEADTQEIEMTDLDSNQDNQINAVQSNEDTEE